MIRSRKSYFAADALVGLAHPAAADKISIRLKWLIQTQFAGPYVALDKAFYRPVDLDVDINPGGPDSSHPQVLAGYGADVIVDWMPSELAVREKDEPTVNIAQIFQRSGIMVVRLSDTIKTTADFKGKTLGVSFQGAEYSFLGSMQRLGYKASSPNTDVTVPKQGYSTDSLLQRQAACIAGMSYNETYKIPKAGLKPRHVVRFSYEDAGVATLEDGLYALQSTVDVPKGVDKLECFLASSFKGRDYAMKHTDEAADIVMAHDVGGNLTRNYRSHVMREVAKLIEPSGHAIGYIGPVDYKSTVKLLLKRDSDPVIFESRATPGGMRSTVPQEGRRHA